MSADQPVVFYSASEGRLSYVNCRSYAYTRASHPYRRPSPGSTTAGLAEQRRSCVHASVSDLYIARECMSCLYLRDCVDWVDSVRTRVDLLQQWRHRSSLQNLSFEITLNTQPWFIVTITTPSSCDLKDWSKWTNLSISWSVAEPTRTRVWWFLFFLSYTDVYASWRWYI